MSKSELPADPRLYVALDLPSVDDARALTQTLGAQICAYKIGLQLLPIGGMDLARELIDAGKHVFLDFKFHDIGATVEKAVTSVAGFGAQLLTVHARPDVMEAAARGAKGSDLKILGVTVLTSLDDAALRKIGYGYSAEDLVLARADQALEAGIDGVVSSPLEAAKLRARLGPDMLIVTPGIRMAHNAAGDQKRISTPRDAIRAGASHIVVGRPINAARDPLEAAREITADLSKA